MLRTRDVILLHCGEHTVLHVEIMEPCFEFSSLSTPVAAAGKLHLLLFLKRGAQRTGSKLLYEKTSITLRGCQSYKT